VLVVTDSTLHTPDHYCTEYGLVSCRSTTGRFRRRSRTPFSEGFHANRWATLGIPLSLTTNSKPAGSLGGGSSQRVLWGICLSLLGKYARRRVFIYSDVSPTDAYREDQGAFFSERSSLALPLPFMDSLQPSSHRRTHKTEGTVSVIDSAPHLWWRWLGRLVRESTIPSEITLSTTSKLARMTSIPLVKLTSILHSKRMIPRN
jgi:hypothetical protein